MLYFGSQPGQAIAIPMPNDVATPLAITGWTGALAFKSILTEVSVSRRVGFQAQSTLDSRTFITIFGDRPGRIRVSGLSFSGSCTGDQTTGAEYVLNFYDSYNAGVSGQPLVVAYGTSPAGVFTAFLTSVDIALNQPELRMAQFGLEFLVLPRKGTSSS